MSRIRPLFALAGLALATLVLVPATGRAQNPFQMMKGLDATPVVMILTSPDVQKELKLTEEQTQQITDVMQEQMKKLPQLFAGGFDKIRENIKAMIDESEKASFKVLKPDQTKRLKQIKLQADGPRAFRDAGLLALELNVSEEQKTKIDEILDSIDKEAFKGFPKVRPTDQDEMRKMMEEFAKARKEADKKNLDRILEVLTAQQRERWNELTGPRFEGSVMPGAGFNFGALFGKKN